MQVGKYDLPKPHLSASAINTYLSQCGKIYDFKYMQGEIGVPAVAAVQGKALHKTNEEHFNHIIHGEDHLVFTADDAVDFSISSFEEEARKDGLVVTGHMKDESVAILKTATRSYFTDIAPGIQPISTEEKIWYISDCGVPIKGFLDLRRMPHDWELQANPMLEEVIVDYKLAASKWALNKLQNSLQFMIYSAAVAVPRVEVQNVKRSANKPTKTRKKKGAENIPSGDMYDPMSNTRLLRHNFIEQDHRHMEYIIEQVAEHITKRIFLPCAPDNWCCNEEWCDYWKMCRGAAPAIGTRKSTAA